MMTEEKIAWEKACRQYFRKYCPNLFFGEYLVHTKGKNGENLYLQPKNKKQIDGVPYYELAVISEV